VILGNDRRAAGRLEAAGLLGHLEVEKSAGTS